MWLVNFRSITSREVLDQQVGDLLAQLGGVEAAILDLDVVAFLIGDLGDDAGIGAGPADAFFFQGLDQRGLVVARRRLGEVLAGGQVEQIQLCCSVRAGSVASSCLPPGGSTLR